MEELQRAEEEKDKEIARLLEESKRLEAEKKDLEDRLNHMNDISLCRSRDKAHSAPKPYMLVAAH